MLYERLLRPALFRLEAEAAHERMTALLSLVGRVPLGGAVLARCLGRPASGLETTVLGLDFPNPIGLAAGFDKDAKLAGVLPSLGFGFLEVGSITLRPQPGNPKPRIFRFPEQEAIINRLGFNNAGAEAAARRLRRLGKSAVPIGINIGLNKDTPKEEAPSEYARTFELLRELGDYYVINVSSPNTAGLRDLQEHLALKSILLAIAERNTAKKPVLVKLSPDLGEALLGDVLDLAASLASGVIISNTTLSRPGLPADLPETRGGLSGQPLGPLSTALIRAAYRHTKGRLPIIGVGGVASGGDAFEKIQAGASLVQLYTGLVYGGPSLVYRMQWELAELLGLSGFQTVAQAVGSGAR